MIPFTSTLIIDSQGAPSKSPSAAKKQRNQSNGEAAPGEMVDDRCCILRPDHKESSRYEENHPFSIDKGNACT